MLDFHIAMRFWQGWRRVPLRTAPTSPPRSFSAALDLGRFDRLDWRRRDDAVETIVRRLDRARHEPLLTPAMVRALQPVDDRSYRAGMLGADAAGLYAGDRLRRFAGRS